MDVLSEVLRVVRLSGAIHFCAEFSQPWAILTSPPEMLASRLVPGAEAVIPFHIATEGRCWLSWGKVEPIPIEVGDVVVFARGAQQRPGKCAWRHAGPDQGHLQALSCADYRTAPWGRG